MEISFLILTDYAESLNGKLYTLGAGWNLLRFPELPQEWRFTVGLGIDVSWDETNQRHTIEVTIEDPDGGDVGEPLTMELEAGRPPGIQAGQDQRMVIAFNVGASFEAAGPHAVVVRSGEQELERSRFYVVEAPPDPTQLAGPEAGGF
jgi:uncharacterized protein DUF6941